MLRSLFLILFASVSTTQVGAVETQISGEVPGMQGRELYLLRTTDFLSNGWTKVESATIDDEGHFKLKIDVAQTGHYILRAGSWHADLFLLPGTAYHLRLDAQQGEVAQTFDDNPFQVTYLEIPSNDPNIIISQFNQAYEQLFGALNYTLALRFNKGSSQYKKQHEAELLKANIISNVDSVFRQNPTADSTQVMFEQFALEVKKWQAGIDDTFTNNLLKFGLGRLDFHLGRSEEKVWQTYFTDSLIHPENPEWVGLFLELHASVSNHPSVSRGAVIEALKMGDYRALRNAIDEYPYTRTEAEKQFLMLSLAKEAWYLGASYRTGVLRLLDAFDLLEKDADSLKKCAKSVRFELTKGTPYNDEGIPFDITLLDYKGDRFPLESLRGELVYLGFFNAKSLSSQRELMVLEESYRKYGRQIKFVMISMDENEDDLTTYLSNHKEQEWLVLRGGGDPVLRHHMNLKAVPQFYFISPEGTLMETYTLKPSEGVQDRMGMLLRGPRPEKLKVWDD